MTINKDYKVFGIVGLVFAMVCFSYLNVSAQHKGADYTMDFCNNNNYSNGDKASFKETREMTLPAGNVLTVDGKQNGGIRVIGSNRNDILVRACIQALGATDAEARSAAQNIRVETASSVIRAEGVSDKSNWSVSYQILVPRMTNLNLTTRNGGIGISGVEGNMEFSAENGGIHLNDVAGNVKGKTINGGLHIVLTGSGWRGSGLDVETTNGGVHLTIPANFAAHIETGTINGGFQSDISSLNVDSKDRSRSRRITTDLNGGGAPIRLITTNGGVHIDSGGSM